MSSLGSTTPFVWASGNIIHVKTGLLPIVGKSSNVQLSSDTDTRVVAFRATRTSSQSFPNVPALPGTVVQFDSIKNDTHGAWDSVNYRYLVPVSGYYDISARFLLQFGVTTGEIVAYLVIDGTVVALQQDFKAGTAGGNQGIFARFLWNLNAGQAVQVRMYQANTGGGAINGVFELGGIEHGAMYVNRLSGPSVVAANETVAMRAVKNTGAQTASGVTQTVASWTSVVQDTHGIFNATTGVATIPVSGTYLCTFQVQLAANSTGARVTQMYKNGAVGVGSMQAESNIYVSFIDRPVMVGGALLKLNAGDNLRLATYQDGAASLNYSTFDASSTNFNIVRVGN